MKCDKHEDGEWKVADGGAGEACAGSRAGCVFRVAWGGSRNFGFAIGDFGLGAGRRCLRTTTGAKFQVPSFAFQVAVGRVRPVFGGENRFRSVLLGLIFWEM